MSELLDGIFDPALVHPGFLDHEHRTLLVVQGLGRASSCDGYAGGHRPRPTRYIWHHVLPQVCGGRTVKANLVQLCDNCHLTVHAILWLLAQRAGEIAKVDLRGIGSLRCRELAQQGYALALAAGTVAKIPNEGGAVAA